MIRSALSFWKWEWKSERTHFFSNEWELSEAQKINEQVMGTFFRVDTLMIFWYITWTNLMIRNTHNNFQTVHTVRFPEKILETENSSTIVLIMAHYICSPVCHNTVWNDGTPPMIHLKMIYRHHCRLTKELLYNFFHTIGNGILLPKLFWPTVRKKLF